MVEEESGLDVLKKEYEKLEKEHELPDFDFLNQNFEIESISAEDTDFLLRKIRKHILDRVSSGLRTLEMFINPQTAPLFIINIIKSFSQTDKDVIQELYNKFAEFEIDAFGVENGYNEEKEIELIKNVSKAWPEVLEDFNMIYKSMKVNYKKESKRNAKSYLG